MVKIQNTPLIETDRLILWKFTQEDVVDLISIMDDQKVNKYLSWFPISSLDDTNQFLRTTFLDYYEKDLSFRYAICPKETNRPIGYMWLSDDRSCNFGYGLKKYF